MEICRKDKCVGCGVCEFICNSSAITMNKDPLTGFVYPIVDESKCKKCNKCVSKCPINNVESMVSNNILDCYAVVSKDSNIRQTSTSGGLAYCLQEKTILSGGVVFSVVSNYPNEIAVFQRIDRLEKINNTQGSKYVQANVRIIYDQIIHELRKQKKVLVIGTPCQISAIKTITKGINTNLTTVELVCHGVSSSKILMDYISEIKIKNDVHDIKFRDYNRTCLALLGSDQNLLYKKYVHDDLFTLAYLKSIILRQSCYHCKFGKYNRYVADLTIGDFWGLGEDSIFRDSYKKGVSLLLIHSERGLQLIESLDNICMEKRAINEAIQGNRTFNDDYLKPPYQRNNFIKYYSLSHNVHRAIQKSIFLSILYFRLRGIIKRIIRK